jgi:uncharacterized protein YlzI (FlbEa/FlbD family)
MLNTGDVWIFVTAQEKPPLGFSERAINTSHITSVAHHPSGAMIYMAGGEQIIVREDFDTITEILVDDSHEKRFLVNRTLDRGE